MAFVCVRVFVSSDSLSFTGHDMASSSKVGHFIFCVVLASFLIGRVTCGEEGVRVAPGLLRFILCGVYCGVC